LARDSAIFSYPHVMKTQALNAPFCVSNPD